MTPMERWLEAVKQFNEADNGKVLIALMDFVIPQIEKAETAAYARGFRAARQEDIEALAALAKPTGENPTLLL